MNKIRLSYTKTKKYLKIDYLIIRYSIVYKKNCLFEIRKTKLAFVAVLKKIYIYCIEQTSVCRRTERFKNVKLVLLSTFLEIFKIYTFVGGNMVHPYIYSRFIIINWFKQ